MTDYPSIRPEDVREGDVVRARFDAAQWPATIEGVVHYSLTNDEDYRLYVGGYVVSGATDLRLVSMGRCCALPEPALRVGDFVWDLSGSGGQITVVTDYPGHSPYCVNGQWREGHNLTRIEPPVGWPVGVPTEDVGTRWWACHVPKCNYHELSSLDRADNIGKAWADLLAAGGVPALAVTR